MKQSILVILLTFSIIFANAQGWMWSKQFTGIGQNIPIATVSDYSGNIYAVGNFSSTVNQDAFTLTALGGLDMFVAKYNKFGQIIWLKQMGGTASDAPYSIALSKDGNYFYISGVTNSNPCIFDGNNMATTGGSDAFIVKYSVDGLFQWVHNTGYGTLNQLGGSICIDNLDNIIQIGAFYTDITFYGGTTTLTSPNASVKQNFISKYNSSGNLLWAKMLQGDNSSITIRSVSASGTGYYFSGIFSGAFNLDVENLTSIGGYDGFLYKTDLNGIGQWVRKVTGSFDDIMWTHKSDSNGYQFLTGYYSSPTLNIDSTTSLTSLINTTNKGGNDIFFMCYNPSGNLQWARTIGSAGNEVSNNIDITNGKSTYTGSFEGTIMFDNNTITSSGSSDVFMAECNSLGTFINALNLSGNLNDVGKAIIYSSTGRNFVASGEFYSNSLSIGATQFANPSTLRDAYVAKYGCFDSLQIQSTQASSCLDGMGAPLEDGTALVTPSEGSEPYTYSWSNGAATPSLIGLAAGNYTVTVSGAYGCTLSKVVSVTRKPFLTATISGVNVLCNGSTTGSATVTASSGNPSYQYHWSNNASTATITNIVAGIYAVTVTDQCGVTLVKSITITQPTALTVSVSKTNVSCNAGINGTATATASGGASGYTYLWSNGVATSSISNLVAGTYSVTVKDSNNCSVITTTTITQPTTVTASINTHTDVNCYGSATGTAKVTSLGGTGPSYLWNTTPVQTTQTSTGLTAGIWNVKVTRSAGCAYAYVTITQPATAVSSYISSQTNVSCNGGNNGSATVTATGGTPGYTYVWSGGGTSTTKSSLSSGTYNVTVRDTKSCSSISNVTITQPTQIVFGATAKSCSNASPCTGTVTPSVSGGTPPYTYSWNTNPIQTTLTATGICVGNFNKTITVTDYLGCPRSKRIKVKILSCLKSISIEDSIITENKNSILLYPNPVSSQLSIFVESDERSGENAIIEIDIYNLLGELISKDKKEIIYGQTVLKDVTYLSPGLYLVTIINQEERFTQRILIQR